MANDLQQGLLSAPVDSRGVAESSAHRDASSGRGSRRTAASTAVPAGPIIPPGSTAGACCDLLKGQVSEAAAVLHAKMADSFGIVRSFLQVRESGADCLHIGNA